MSSETWGPKHDKAVSDKISRIRQLEQKVLEAAEALVNTRPEAWGDPETGQVETYDAPSREYEALRKAVRALQKAK